MVSVGQRSMTDAHFGSKHCCLGSYLLVLTMSVKVKKYIIMFCIWLPLDRTRGTTPLDRSMRYAVPASRQHQWVSYPRQDQEVLPDRNTGYSWHPHPGQDQVTHQHPPLSPSRQDKGLFCDDMVVHLLWSCRRTLLFNVWQLDYLMGCNVLIFHKLAQSFKKILSGNFFVLKSFDYCLSCSQSNSFGHCGVWCTLKIWKI